MRGCDLVKADINDAAALSAAFKGDAGVLLRSVARLSRSAGYRHRIAIGDRRRAPMQSRLLIDHRRAGNPINLLIRHSIIEQVLGELFVPISFLRPAWLMENSSWDVASATKNGTIPSFLKPLDRFRWIHFQHADPTN